MDFSRHVSVTSMAMRAQVESAPLTPDGARAFAVAMPARYRELFDAPAQEEHAAIAARRAGARAHVETWRRTPHGVSVIAVVADDRPGLLARVSATFAAHDVDVVAAQSFRRATAAGDEVFALFWIRSASDQAAGIDDYVVESMGEVLDRVIEETLSVEQLIARIAVLRGADSRGGTRVHFEGEAPTLLVVEAWDRRGLLLAMARALFLEHVHIVRSEVRTVDGRALNRFEVAEVDGTPLSRARKQRIQAELLAAIEAPRR